MWPPPPAFWLPLHDSNIAGFLAVLDEAAALKEAEVAGLQGELQTLASLSSHLEAGLATTLAERPGAGPSPDKEALRARLESERAEKEQLAWKAKGLCNNLNACTWRPDPTA